MSSHCSEPLARGRGAIAFGGSSVFFDASQGSLMAKIATISRHLAKITMRDCLAVRGALRAPLTARERLMVIFARRARNC